MSKLRVSVAAVVVDSRQGKSARRRVFIIHGHRGLHYSVPAAAAVTAPIIGRPSLIRTATVITVHPNST